METMNYYGGGPPSSLDYRQSPHHGGHHHHGAYHPAYAQSIGLRGTVNGNTVAGGVPPMYRGVGSNGTYTPYEAAYRDRYASSASPNPYGIPSDIGPAYGGRTNVGNVSGVVDTHAVDGFNHVYGNEQSNREVGGGGRAGFYSFRSDGYRMASGFNQYQFQHHHHAQPHLQHPHQHHLPYHPQYNSPDHVYPPHHPHTTHLNQATHNHQPYMSRSIGRYGYSRHPNGAERAFQHTPYQHHHTSHHATVLHPQTFPMPGAPSRDSYGAGAAEPYSSTSSPSIQSPTTAIDPATTTTTTATPPAAATAASCGAANDVADAPTTNRQSTTSTPSTKTSPTANIAESANDGGIQSTTTATTSLTALGSIFGGNADAGRVTPFGASTIANNNNNNNSMPEDGSRANCAYPTPPPSAAPDATEDDSETSAKDQKLRKQYQRERNLTKMAAMNRRLEEGNFGSAPQMSEDIDRLGNHRSRTSPCRDYRADQPYLGYHHYHQMNQARYNAMMSSRGSLMPMSLPWHPMSGGTDWINSPYGAKNSHYRKRLLTPEICNTIPLPIHSPASTSSVRSSSGSRAGHPNAHSKSMSGVFESDFIPSKKKRKSAEQTSLKSDETIDIIKSRAELKNITPLPGFQQAFGSTEIGRFSEVFFNAPESPIDGGALDSEAGTLSPQPWEMGDSMEGPHPHVPFGGGSVHSMYSESYESTGSPSSGSYFSELRCGDY